MKTKIKILILGAACLFTFSSMAQSDGYKLGAGLMIDFGDGMTLVGPHAKYFFMPEHAVEAAVLFGKGVTLGTAAYTYNGRIPGVNGLLWYVGAGPSVAFGSGTSVFAAVAPVGVEFAIPSLPIAIGGDWRPSYFFIEDETYFDASRFSISFRYTLK